MHTTLAILAAAGQIVAAWEDKGYEPQAPSPEQTKPLATVTALSDGHLPTCFTGHPTHPCPTSPPSGKRDMPGDVNSMARALSIKPFSWSASQGEQHLPTTAPSLAPRDGPRKISGDYVPRPNEWAIPSNFTFTDTVSKNSTGFASPSGSLTTSLSESSHAEPTKAPQMGGDFMQKFNVSSLIDAITKDMYRGEEAAGGPPKAPESPAMHKRDTGAEAMLDSMTRSMFPSSKVPAQSGVPSAMPTISPQQHNATNTSSSAHLSAMIGTLLNGAMFPGQMRAASTSSAPASVTPTTSSVESAPLTTQAPSTASETLVPISMSQQPNTTAPNASLQAFVHPINTEQVNEAEATTSSSVTSTPSASATPEQRQSKFSASPDMEEMDSESDDDDFWKSSEPTLPPSRQWNEDKFDKELDAYLSSVIPADEPSSQAHVAPTSSAPVQANSQPTMSSSVSSSASITEAATTSTPQPTTFSTSSRSVVRPPTTEQAVHWNRARAAKRFIS